MRANSVDLDEVAHDEPPQQDLRCLQILLFSSLVVIESNHILNCFPVLSRIVPAMGRRKETLNSHFKQVPCIKQNDAGEARWKSGTFIFNRFPVLRSI